MIGLPYGRVFAKLSDKQKIEIPNVLRLQRKAEIIRLYYKFLEESNLNNMKLSRATLFRILDVCSAKERKAVTCLDSYVALGMEVCILVLNHQIIDNLSIICAKKKVFCFFRTCFARENSNFAREKKSFARETYAPPLLGQTLW